MNCENIQVKDKIYNDKSYTDKIYTYYDFEECKYKKDVYNKCVKQFGKAEVIKTAKKDGLFYFVGGYPDGKICVIFEVKKKYKNWQVSSYTLEEEDHKKEYLPKCIQEALRDNGNENGIKT